MLLGRIVYAAMAAFVAEARALALLCQGILPAHAERTADQSIFARVLVSAASITYTAPRDGSVDKRRQPRDALLERFQQRDDIMSGTKQRFIVPLENGCSWRGAASVGVETHCFQTLRKEVILRKISAVMFWMKLAPFANGIVAERVFWGVSNQRKHGRQRNAADYGRQFKARA